MSTSKDKLEAMAETIEFAKKGRQKLIEAARERRLTPCEKDLLSQIEDLIDEGERLLKLSNWRPTQ